MCNSLQEKPVVCHIKDKYRPFMTFQTGIVADGVAIIFRRVQRGQTIASPILDESKQGQVHEVRPIIGVVNPVP